MNIKKTEVLNMRYIFYILIPLLLLTNCNNSRSDKGAETNLGLKEEFVIKGFNVGVEIYLSPNFTFLNRFYSRACTGGFFIKDIILT